MYDLLCNVLTSADDLLSQLLDMPDDLLAESSSLGPSTNNLDHHAVNTYDQPDQSGARAGIMPKNGPASAIPGHYYPGHYYPGHYYSGHYYPGHYYPGHLPFPGINMQSSPLVNNNINNQPPSAASFAAGYAASPHPLNAPWASPASAIVSTFADPAPSLPVISSSPATVLTKRPKVVSTSSDASGKLLWVGNTLVVVASKVRRQEFIM